MLESLRAYFERDDLPDDPMLRVESLEFGENSAVLTISVVDYGGSQVWQRWRVRAIGLRDHKLGNPFGELAIYEGAHPLVRQHTDSRQELYFRGIPKSVAETIGRLLLAHQAVVGTWIPFDQFFNSAMNLEELLAGGFGLLVDGPSFLVEAYSRVLAEEGLKPNSLAPRPAKWWDGVQWANNTQPLTALVVSDSYFVAEGFDEEELPDAG